MSESVFRSSRSFRVWLYSTSHSILLLRSVRTSDEATRIDVIFKPVRYMSMPTTLDGIDVRTVDPAQVTGEMGMVVAACGAGDRVFALSGPQGRAWVVSAVAAWHEDECSDNDASYFDVPRIVWQ